MNNNVKMILETRRLILRFQQESDIDFLVFLWSDPKVTEFIGGSRDKSFLAEEFGKTAKDPYAEKYDLWPVIEKQTNLPVGHCGILEKAVEGKTEYEINYFFDPSVWGRGYATEMAAALAHYALSELGIDRVVALIAPENTASVKVAENIGMSAAKELTRPDGQIKTLYILEKRAIGAD